MPGKVSSQGLEKMKFFRPTRAEVNLSNLAYNFRQVKKLLKPATKVMVTVKADAYGHGLIPVARKLRDCGVDFFGVASIDEGIILRQAGIRLPILVLGPMLKNDIGPLFKYNLSVTVCSLDFALALNRMARRLKQPVKVHIKVDTGMGRLGVLCDGAEELVKKIYCLSFLKIEGIFTHFAFADTDKFFTNRQIDLFGRLVSRLEDSGIKIPLKHTANSMGLVNHQESHFNLVRPGIVIYGLRPADKLRIKLKPVLSLKTKVVFVKKMPGGCGISYAHTYVTEDNTRIAILPIGYGDGYPRLLSDMAPVLIRGKRFKAVGRICMDQMMVDIKKSSVKEGDEAVLIGSQKKSKITTEELAELCGTIPYEIVCGLGSRIPRVYID